MANDDDPKAARGAPAKPDGRQARLEQALRANILKRKDKTKAIKAAAQGREQGATDPSREE